MLRIALVLVVICFISAASLTATHDLTWEKIEEAERARINEALSEVFPFANFVERDGYHVAEKDNQILGYAAIAEGRGFGGRIKLVVGIDNENRVERVVVISHTETPGLGSRIAEEGFLGQFKKKDLGDLKLMVDGGEIDAVTGATISSRAVTDAVRKKVRELIEMLGAAV